MFLLVIFMSFRICVGSSSNELIVSKISIFPNIQNPSTQNLNVVFQFNPNKSSSNTFPGKVVRFSVQNEQKTVLESKSVVFLQGYMDNINFHGVYVGLTAWTMLGNENQIQVSGYVTAKANGYVLIIEEMTKFVITNIQNYKIKFAQHSALDLSLMSVDGKNNSLPLDSIGTIICRASKGRNNSQPKFRTESKLMEQALEFDRENKETRLLFRAQKENHGKAVWCIVDNIERSIRINVLHPPTKVLIIPKMWDTIKTGSYMTCAPADGNPKPKSKWTFISGPQNASRYYQIMNNGKTFALHDSAPVSSQWEIGCESTNYLGKHFLNINFVAELNPTTLLKNQLEKMETNQLTWKNSINEKFDAMQNKVKDLLKIWESAGINVSIIDSKRRNSLQNSGAQLQKCKPDSKDSSITWKIENIQSKYESSKTVYSKPYIIKGYKMCLSFTISKNWGLSLAFVLMESNDDDKLQWPFPRKAEIVIVDQDTGESVLLQKFNKDTALFRRWPHERPLAYNRPRGFRNEHGDGFMDHMSYDELRLTPGAIKADNMLVRLRIL